MAPALDVPEDEDHHVRVVVRGELVVRKQRDGQPPVLEHGLHDPLVRVRVGSLAGAVHVEDDDALHGRGGHEGRVDVVVHAQVARRDRGVQEGLVDVVSVRRRQEQVDADVPDQVAVGLEADRERDDVPGLVEVLVVEVGYELAGELLLAGVVRDPDHLVHHQDVPVVGVVEGPEGLPVGVEHQGVLGRLLDRVPVVTRPAAVGHVAGPDDLVGHPV
jgi:hypothetical protein